MGCSRAIQASDGFLRTFDKPDYLPHRNAGRRDGHDIAALISPPGFDMSPGPQFGKDLFKKSKRDLLSFRDLGNRRHILGWISKRQFKQRPEGILTFLRYAKQ
jgi:hypothetical protein